MTGSSAAVPEAIGALGPFFAFETHGARALPSGPWRAMTEVAGEESPVLRDRVAAVRDHLAAGSGRPARCVESRVAASVAHLGLTARLVSPLLALTALHGRPPRLDLSRIWWQPLLGGAFPLSLPETAAGEAGGLPEAVVEGPVAQLVEAVRAFSVSRRVLWGNVASAVNGAAVAAAGSDTELGRRVAEVARELLNDPVLRGAHSGDGTTSGFRRRSCCLIYRSVPGARAAGGALCGDCVLAGRVRSAT